MSLRRGFKADAEWIAADVRAEQVLFPDDPLCPWHLAKRLDFTVLELKNFRADFPNEVGLLRSCTGAKGFSAVTLFNGSARTIILNDGHGRARQAADLSHELAHGLLHHRPLPLRDGNGVRCFDASAEEEAKWLGPALLVPRPAALRVVRQGMELEEAARAYGVSIELLRMRLNVTAAARQVGASR